MIMMRVRESGMRVLSLMKPAFCVQFSTACGHMAAAAAALSCSKGMSADFVTRLSCHLCDMEILGVIFFLPSREIADVVERVSSFFRGDLPKRIPPHNTAQLYNPKHYNLKTGSLENL